MIPSDRKKLYSRFIEGHKGKLHFAAHSHHFWPDVSREAQLEYWDDCAKSSDHKWDRVFSEIIPGVQKHIARILNLKETDQIVFAPNSHELSTRLLSLFLGKEKLKILTTSSEFHSWKRQVLRLKELPLVEVKMLDVETPSALMSELKEELKKNPDILFISQVFFDSGMAFTQKELEEIVAMTPKETMIVIDGYHGFAAIPTDLSSLEGRIFYLAGGYKYAQAGEGVGFMVVPKGNWRPANTGWFAEFGDLSKPKGSEVGYTSNGMAFMGATQDPSGLYRFKAVWDQFLKLGIGVEEIHSVIKNLQILFIKGLGPEIINQGLKPLFTNELSHHGHFLTFRAQDEELAKRIQERLLQENILIDRRGERLRFGFGFYADEADVHQVINALKKLPTHFD